MFKCICEEQIFITLNIKTAPIVHQAGEENKKIQLKFIKIVWDQFYYKGNVVAELRGSMEHSLNTTGLVSCVGSRWPL
jgi:hypothetical protein